MVTDLKGLPDHLVLERNCIDGYLFLRFFKLLVLISAVGCCITWPILFPVNATGGGGETQLDILSFSNVQNPNRYYAHALVAWIYLGMVSLTVTYERMTFIGLRQAYCTNKEKAERLPSRTVLFMSVEERHRSIGSLANLLGSSMRRAWLQTNCEDLEDMVADRTDVGTKLEAAEVKFTKEMVSHHLKEGKDQHVEDSDNSEETLHRWMTGSDRPTHRLKPVIGKKVDTISWAHDEIHRLNGKIANEQNVHHSGKAEILPAAFVEFQSLGAAQRAYQTTLSGKSMRPCFIDVQPDEIIWANLSTKRMERKIRLILGTAIMAVITFMWTPIVAFVGTLTNINYLTREVPFLGFIDNIPPVILGVVTGLLPTIVLALCVILVPVICRFLSKKLVKDPTLSAVELRTQTWYFAFQVIQVFLVTTFTSGAAAVAAQIVQQPTLAVTLLAKNLPKASNFYLSYFILYGLAQAAFQLFSVMALLLCAGLGRFVDKTPRKMYNRWIGLAGLGWGSEYPKWTNLGVIAISYSCIAPLVLGFATIGFTFLYLAFRYKWLFMLGNKVDMKGEAYSRALQQLMTGVYLSCICLIGLFAIGSAGSASSAGPLVLMIVFLVAVIIFQVVVDYALAPLEQGLPLDLISRVGADKQTAGDNDSSTHNNSQVNGDVDQQDSKSPERRQDQVQYTGNKLTQKVQPYIEGRFFADERGTKFELPEVQYEYETAYLNPAIVAKEPLIWLARDKYGMSKKLIKDNQAAGIKSTDEYTWFEEDKPCWDMDKAFAVDEMLDDKQVPRKDEKEEKKKDDSANRLDEGSTVNGED